MAKLIQPFNANNYDPTQGVGGLPIGRHPVVIQGSDVKATKANDGGYLQLDLLITDGPQKGTVGAYRINLYNASEVAVGIANRQMSAVSHVTGVFNIEDTQQLHNIPFVIEVGPQKNDPQYTEVKKVFDVNGNEPGQSGNNNGGGAAQTQQNNGGNNGDQNNNGGGNGGGGWGGGNNGGGNDNGNNGGGGGFTPPADQNNGGNGGGNGGGWNAPDNNGGGNGGNNGGDQNNNNGGGGGGWQQGNAGGGGGNGNGPWGGGQS